MASVVQSLFLAFLFANIFIVSSVSGASLNDVSKGLSGVKGAQYIENAVIKPAFLPELDVKNGNTSYEVAQSLIYKIINYILFFAGTIAVIMIIIGGFLYVVNAGEDGIQKQAKNTILYAVIGLTSMFFAYTVITNVIKYLYQENQTENYQQIEKLPQKNPINK